MAVALVELARLEITLKEVLRGSFLELNGRKAALASSLIDKVDSVMAIVDIEERNVRRGSEFEKEKEGEGDSL